VVSERKEVSTMEGVILEPGIFGNADAAGVGLLVLAAAGLAGICLSYLADEDRLGRTHYWMDEPLCGIGEPGTAEGKAVTPEYRKAA
jgi:hypothetical protein